MTEQNEAGWFPATLEGQGRLFVELREAETLPFEVAMVIETMCQHLHGMLSDPDGVNARTYVANLLCERELAMTVQPDDETSEVGWVDTDGHGYVWSLFPNKERSSVGRVLLENGDETRKGEFHRVETGWVFNSEEPPRRLRINIDPQALIDMHTLDEDSRRLANLLERKAS